MAKETKVIHVHLIFKKTSRFFGSISAIYSEFTAEDRYYGRNPTPQGVV